MVKPVEISREASQLPRLDGANAWPTEDADWLFGPGRAPNGDLRADVELHWFREPPLAEDLPFDRDVSTLHDTIDGAVFVWYSPAPAWPLWDESALLAPSLRRADDDPSVSTTPGAGSLCDMNDPARSWLGHLATKIDPERLYLLRATIQP